MRRIWVKYDEYLEGSTTPPPHAPTGELESAAAEPCRHTTDIFLAVLTVCIGTFMIYQSRAIEQYPTGIRALLAGVSGLLYRRSTWVAFFVETAAARSRADQAKRVRPTTCSGEIRPGRIWSYRRPYLVSRALGGIWGGICEYRPYFVFLAFTRARAPMRALRAGIRKQQVPFQIGITNSLARLPTHKVRRRRLPWLAMSRLHASA